MSHAPGLVTVFGGSGFVGRYIVRRLAKEGWRVRVAVRRPNEAMFVKTYGDVGQVEPVLANILDDYSVQAALGGADAVVNCVGILQESSRQKFHAVHADGAQRIARLATAGGVKSLVHLSALSADGQSDSTYAKTKAEAEALVSAHFPGAVILRPSVVFGPDDGFFNRFAAMSRLPLVLPLVGADTLFQPVYVDDVAKAAVLGVTGAAKAGVYELGGPDIESLRALTHKTLGLVRRKRLVFNIPFAIAAINAWFFDMWTAVLMGMFQNRILTRDQVRLLAHDNVVSEGARTLADLGVEPTPMAGNLENYLYCYRPNGQFEAIKESAGNLSA